MDVASTSAMGMVMSRRESPDAIMNLLSKDADTGESPAHGHRTKSNVRMFTEIEPAPVGTGKNREPELNTTPPPSFLKKLFRR